MADALRLGRYGCRLPTITTKTYTATLSGLSVDGGFDAGILHRQEADYPLSKQRRPPGSGRTAATTYWGRMTIRAHADKETVAAKLARLEEQHIAPLTALARRIQSQHAGVPFFDPDNCGVDARVLILLEAPGPKATDFVSQDNSDKTAENLNRLMTEASLPRREIVLWNVVPFYIGTADRSRLRAARQSDLDAGRPWVTELCGLLPRIDAVVRLGRKSQQARPLVNELCPVARVLEGWHPSPLAMNRDLARWRQLLGVLHEAATSHAD